MKGVIMRSTKKYAIRFPGLDPCRPQESLNIFSEDCICDAINTLSSVLNAAESLVGFIVQKNRTGELKKQISAQKDALDIEQENREEQLRIQYSEESNRMKIKLEAEKKRLELDFQRLQIEMAERSKKIEVSFEQDMRTNQLLYKIVLHEKEVIDNIKPYIEMLADDYSNRREYIKYCEIERKSLILINEYIEQMI